MAQDLPILENAPYALGRCLSRPVKPLMRWRFCLLGVLDMWLHQAQGLPIVFITGGEVNRMKKT